MNRLTDKEKSQLQYKPVLEYIDEKVESPDYIEAVESADIAYAAQHLGTKTWANIFDIINRIKALIALIDSRYIGTDAQYMENGKVELSDKQEAYLSMLYNMDSMNIGVIEDELTTLYFDNYREALSGLPTSFYNAIISIYEDYQGGVYGYTDIEVYSTLLDMLEEWEDLVEFFRYTVISQLDKAAARTLTSDSKVINDLVDIEVNQIYALATLNRQRIEIEGQISDYNSNSNRYQELFAEYIALIQDGNNARDKIINKAQLVNTVDDKIVMADVVLSKLEYLVYQEHSASLAAGLKEAVSSISSILDSSDILSIGYNLQMAVDDSKATIKAIKEDKASTASNEIKKKLSEDLTYACHIQNELVRPLARKIIDIENVPYAAEPIIDIIAQSLEKSSIQYKNLISSYYVLNQNDSNAVDTIIDNLEQKKEARYYYRILDGVQKYIQSDQSLSETILDSVIQKSL